MKKSWLLLLSLSFFASIYASASAEFDPSKIDQESLGPVRVYAVNKVRVARSNQYAAELKIHLKIESNVCFAEAFAIKSKTLSESDPRDPNRQKTEELTLEAYGRTSFELTSCAAISLPVETIATLHVTGFSPNQVFHYRVSTGGPLAKDIRWVTFLLENTPQGWRVHPPKNT